MKGAEQEGQERKHASSHAEDVCNEIDKTTALDPQFELSYEANDTNTHDENKSENLGEEDCSHEPHLLTG